MLQRVPYSETCPAAYAQRFARIDGRTPLRFRMCVIGDSHALISHELRAPCVTCGYVPDLSGVMLVPLLAILLGLVATNALCCGTE